MNIMRVLKTDWRRRVLIEKLIVAELFSKFLVHGTQMFITLFTALQTIRNGVVASVTCCNLGNTNQWCGLGARAYPRKSPLQGRVSAVHAVFMHGFICLCLVNNNLPLSEDSGFHGGEGVDAIFSILLSIDPSYTYSTLFSITLSRCYSVNVMEQVALVCRNSHHEGFKPLKPSGNYMYHLL
jgi:hypothetical protein